MPSATKKTADAGNEEYFKITRSGSKKILIEHTTLLTVVAILVFKTIGLPLLLPDDVTLLYSVPEVLLSLPCDSLSYPTLLGLLLSYLTWHTMYLDSAVPGVDPPTPLSPRKFREASGADFHLNYAFTIIIGPMVAIFLYAGWV